MTRAALTLVLSLGVAASAAAQFDLPAAKAGNRQSFADMATLTAAFDPPTARPGQTVKMRVTVTPAAGAWTYPAGPGEKNRFRIPAPVKDGLVFFGDVLNPTRPPELKPTLDDPTKQEPVFPFPVTWELPAVVSPDAAAGKKTVTLTGSFVLVCLKDTCLPSDAMPTATLEVSGDPVPPAPAAAVVLAKAFNPPAEPPAGGAAPPAASAAGPPAAKKPGGVVAGPPVPLDRYEASLEEVRGRLERMTVQPPSGGLSAFLLTAAAWGLISLVTPCVFPMIPITVSIFIKQSHNSTGEALKLAVVYCLTIILVLGVSAIALLKVFVALSVNPWMNLFLGGLFVFFALSLFGMYDISLPQGMLRFTQGKQGQGGLVGTVFGALAFTIVSFTCVAPFLGGFAGMASSGNFSSAELVAAGLAFSTAFASPFFLLALFPSLLKKLPRSGGWLDSVKVVMGFLELAAALKFVRTAELSWLPHPEFFTYDVVLGGWVAIAGVCGLYLLNVYRLPHDEERPHIGVLRLMFAVLFVGFGVYLTPALFRGPDGQPQRPGGAVFAWVDAFLLPEPARGGDHLRFRGDLNAALADARAVRLKTDRPRYVFVDFTGVTCTNCKYNEANVFTRPDVRELLEKYELVQLYTDVVPVEFFTSPPSRTEREDQATANRAFQKEAFGTIQLPLYAILEPLAGGGVRVAGVYDEGKINDPAAFAAFLRAPLEAAGGK